MGSENIMQVVWVLVAMKMSSGLNSATSYGGVGTLPHWQPFTAGMFASEPECQTAAKALGTKQDIKPYSARCQPERLQ